MAASVPTKTIGHGVVVAPLPLSDTESIGCQNSATARLRRECDLLHGVPDAITPAEQAPVPVTGDMWMHCRNWWNERGPKATHTANPRT